MLRAIMNGQSALKDELLGEIKKLDNKIDKLDIKVDKFEENLTKRIDKLGSQLAYLEDDTPTRKEFDRLDKRVKRVENIIASA